MSLTPKDIFDAARINFRQRFPYFKAATFAVRPWEKKGLGTLAMDPHARLLWDPDVVEKWGVEGTGPVYHHEISHWLRKHFDRAEAAGVEGMEANIPEDLEINQPDIFHGDWSLPTGGIFPKTFGLPENLTFEEYLRELRKQAKDSKRQSQPESDPSKRPPPGSGQCGGIARNPWPEEADEAEDKNAPPRVTAHEQEVIRQKVAQDIVKWSKTRGTIPGNWLEWAETTLKPPRVPWTRVLAKFVRSCVSKLAGAVDFSYRRISRSYMARRIILGAGTPISPGMHRPVPEVAVVADVSGSMGIGEGSPLERALSEVRGVVKSLGVPVRAFACDAAVGPCQRIFSKADVSRLNTGHGGTDMRIGITAAAEARPAPGVIVILSDGETLWPEADEMPRAEVVVVLIGDHCPDPPAHLSNVVRVPLDELETVKA